MNIWIPNTNCHYRWPIQASNCPSEIASGSHCGCPGNNPTYDIVTLINSDVYSFNGEILKMNYLMHATETFVLRFTGGSWFISEMKQFYDTCTTSRVDDSSSSLTVSLCAGGGSWEDNNDNENGDDDNDDNSNNGGGNDSNVGSSSGS